MATRLRKIRRQRGSRYCGWGQIGQHRLSGSRGGVGGAGKHKHLWIRTVLEEPDHFGHESLNSNKRTLVRKWLNLSELSSLSYAPGIREKEGCLELDLSSLGFQKLLGSGNVSKKYLIKVPLVSKNAKSKIESAGGRVIIEHGEH
jgi:large subunit ribosomal protein L15